MVSNWCEVCQEACTDHPTICSICGTTLTTAPPSNATATPNNNDTTNDNHEQLLQEMRQASADLRNILGSLRGQVQDLDVLTRNIIDGREGDPQEIWDPANAMSTSRPTGKEVLNKIPRFVLDEHSTLFRQATLRVNTDLTLNVVSGVSSMAPAALQGGDGESTQQPQAQPQIPAIGPSNSDISTIKNNFKRIDCTLGEFGSAQEYMFEMGTVLVLASPVTGKGGLDAETKERISHLKACANNVVLFMKRGGGLTFVQKARMAQTAGASAVIIGNNMANPWPYVMKDSKGESKKPGQSVSIPVAMIKEEDGNEILKKFEKKKEILLQGQQRKPSQPPIPKQIILGNEKRSQVQQQHELQIQPTVSFHQNVHEDSYTRRNQCLSCELTITAQSSDCPVCCENLQNSETVIQLPGCGHIFHESCALVWLKSHNTCPYCRRELPTDDPEYERERRRRQQQEQEQRASATAGNTTGRNNDTNGAVSSFYG